MDMKVKRQQDLKDSVVRYLDSTGHLDVLLEEINDYKTNKEPAEYVIPFRFTVNIDFPLLTEISGELAEILVKEPYQFNSLIENVIQIAVIPLAGIQLMTHDVLVTFRVNLPVYPFLLNPTKHRTEIGLSVILGILTEVTAPYKYIRSTVLKCPTYSCINSSAVRVYQEDIKGKRRCLHCNVAKEEIHKAQELGEEVTAVFMDPKLFTGQKSSKISNGVTIFFRDHSSSGLQLGSKYTVTVCPEGNKLVSCGIYECLPEPLTRRSLGIPLPPLPSSILKLINFLSVVVPESPWALNIALSCQLASHIAPVNCFLHLKAGILLSLASQGENNQPVPLLCIGPDGRALLDHCGKLAARTLSCGNWHSTNAAGVCMIDPESSKIWQEAGPLLLAKTGVLHLGEWSKYQELNSSMGPQVKQALESGEVQFGTEGHQILTCGPPAPCYRLQCSIWALCQNKPDIRSKAGMNSYRTAVELFGMPFIGTLNSTEIKDWVEQKLKNATGSTLECHLQHHIISEEDLKKFLSVITSCQVTVTKEASLLLRRYFIACRRARPGCLPLTSIKTMTALSKAHARISLRREVTEDDVVFVAYLYEEAMSYIFGPLSMPNVSLRNPVLNSKSSVAEQVEDNLLQFSVWLGRFLSSLVGDKSVDDYLNEDESMNEE